MKNCFKLIDETAKQLPMNTAAAAVFICPDAGPQEVRTI